MPSGVMRTTTPGSNGTHSPASYLAIFWPLRIIKRPLPSVVIALAIVRNDRRQTGDERSEQVFDFRLPIFHFQLPFIAVCIPILIVAAGAGPAAKATRPRL